MQLLVSVFVWSEHDAVADRALRQAVHSYSQPAYATPDPPRVLGHSRQPSLVQQQQQQSANGESVAHAALLTQSFATWAVQRGILNAGSRARLDKTTESQLRDVERLLAGNTLLHAMWLSATTCMLVLDNASLVYVGTSATSDVQSIVVDSKSFAYLRIDAATVHDIHVTNKMVVVTHRDSGKLSILECDEQPAWTGGRGALLTALNARLAQAPSKKETLAAKRSAGKIDVSRARDMIVLWWPLPTAQV